MNDEITDTRLAEQERRQRDARDREILSRESSRLARETRDILDYQAPIARA